MSHLVRLERSGPVAVLTLNRPERHNSLVPALLEELLSCLDHVQNVTEARAVVLQAEGRSFSTGGDIGGFAEHHAEIGEYAAHLVGLLNRAILALMDLRVPVIGAVHGIVNGGSLGLVLACDVVLMAPQASFTPYYSLFGFSPDGGWTALLPCWIGPRRTAEVLVHNQTIQAEQALAWGLASRIVPAGQIREAALATAQEIATRPPGSLARTKQLLSLAYGDLAKRLEAERAQFIQQIQTDEARRGIADYLEKRFSG